MFDKKKNKSVGHIMTFWKWEPLYIKSKVSILKSFPRSSNIPLKQVHSWFCEFLSHIVYESKDVSEPDCALCLC